MKLRLTLLVALVLVSSPWARSQEEEEPVEPSYCRMRLLIDSNVSGFVLRGTNALIPPTGAALNAPITMTSGQRTAYVGAMYINYLLSGNATNCPTNLTELSAALQNTTWRSNGTDFPYKAATGPFQGIAMYPTQINGLTAGQTYRPEHLLWNITTRSVSISPAGAISLSGNSSLLQGYLFTANVLTGDRYDNIAGSSGNFSARGTISMQQGLLTIRLSSFNVSTVGYGELTVGSTKYVSVTTLNFVGNMTMQADLSCPSYCGDYGQCYSYQNTTLCHCDCGWSRDRRSGTCTLASGYCDPTLRP